MKFRKFLLALTAMAIFTSSMTSCGNKIDNTDIGTMTLATKNTNAITNEQGQQIITVPPKPNENLPDKTSVHVVCAGDNLIHDTIYLQAKNRTDDGSYDFSPVYERVVKYIKPADLAILNQETIVTGEFAPSTYPTFCSPEALGDHMVEIGFDAISMSNNHVLDKGESGLIATLDYWDKRHPNIIRYGAYRNTQDMDNIRITTINNITIAFLGYMEHTNGIKHNAEQGTELVYLDELDLIEKQIKKADELADVVIVSPHFGVEVTNEVSSSQRSLSKKFAEWGADVIVGTQPHTIQECNWVEADNGNKAFVYYCLGNFVSAMGDNRAMMGGLGDFTIIKDTKTGKVTIENPKVIPIITHFEHNYSNVTIYPLSEYNQDLAYAHGMSIFNMDLIYDIYSNVPEEFLSIE
ncbi:MAG: CapA family protein [Ruminococcus sp.]|nr:CapA family protein [Ruminococcus sp.]